MQVQPYLCFEGRTEEALTFYREALGAELEEMMRFGDSVETCASGMVPPGAENKIMHASMRFGESTVMMSDGRCSGQPQFQGISLSVTADNEDKADQLFAKLAEGGEVQMPMGKTFFSPRFGMVADRFGVSWMVLAMPEAPQS